MRIATGIIMIILGAVALGTNIFGLWLYDWRINVLDILMFAWTIFAFIGGFLCLMGRYWGVCLASAIAAVVLGIFGFLVIAGGIASIVFISLRKKELQEISDLVDGNDVSDGD